MARASQCGRPPMILFVLRCSKGHDFEAWFRNGDTYEQQALAGEIACAVCGDTKVEKALMAPAVRASSTKADSSRAAELLKTLRAVQEHVEKHFDHVGTSFAEEARKMHYGEAEKRSIYGETSPAEAKELREEGISVSQIPWLPRQDS
jgi:hypothetical protein